MQSQFCVIIGKMSQSEMRQHLYQHKILKDEEYEKLLSLPSATANESLFFMIKKKGKRAFYDFLQILKDTGNECPSHVEIYDTLTSDLKDRNIPYPPVLKV